MSPIAQALYQRLREASDSIVIEELVEALRSSKTAIRHAFAELASEGLISYEQET